MLNDPLLNKVLQLNGEASCIAIEHAEAISKYIIGSLCTEKDTLLNKLGISASNNASLTAIAKYTQNTIDLVAATLKMDWVNNDQEALDIIKSKIYVSLLEDIKKENTMTTQLFGAIKETRDAAINLFSEKIHELNNDKSNDGHDILFIAASAAIDKAIGGTLDAVEEHYEEITELTPQEDDDSIHIITITSGLSSSFFEEINT